MTVPDKAAPLILFVDDEATAVKYFQRAIDSMASVLSACSVEEGKRLLDLHAGSLLVLVSDQRMPGAYGNELLRYARERHPQITRILTTAYSEIEHTVEAVNQGQIHRYIQKPWDINALRMELKQALEWSLLRRDHARLLQEKLAVQQKQIVANRLGMLHTLCACLAAAPDAVDASEVANSAAANYLAGAAAAGVEAAGADWLRFDFAETTAAEALRGAHFGHALATALAALAQRYRDYRGEDGLTVLAEVVGGSHGGGGELVIAERALFSEFLSTAAGTAVSPRHVAWLAFLIWLHEHRMALQLTPMAGADGVPAMRCGLQAATAPDPGAAISSWVERFCLP